MGDFRNSNTQFAEKNKMIFQLLKLWNNITAVFLKIIGNVVSIDRRETGFLFLCLIGLVWFVFQNNSLEHRESF